MHGNVARQQAPHIFHGWLVVAGAFAVTFVGYGCVYSFTAFIDSLQREFGASRGSVSVVFSLAAFLYFGLGSVSGPLADRVGSRRLAVAGMLLVGLGLAAVAAAQSLAQVYAVYGLAVGLGVGLSYVPAMGAVQRWFARRRALASGLASSGIGAGTLVVPPLAALLIAHLGWRPAYVALGVTAAIVGAGLALLIENDPRDRGLAPDGEALGAAAAPPAGATLRDAIRSRRFLALYGACLACSFGVFVPFVHLAPYAIDHGVAQSSAVLLVSAIGIGSTIGRFLLGGLADRLGHDRSLVATYLAMALAMVIWLVSATFWPLAVFGFVFGAAYGGWVALLPAVVMDHFGGRNISGIIGILYTSAGIGTLLGPSAAGFASSSDAGADRSRPMRIALASGERISERPHYDDDIRNWSRIVRLCRDNGVRLTAVLSPLGPQTHAALDDADTEAVAERISRLAPVWDFRSAREPSNTPDMWPDPRHYRREVAAFMLARMYGGDLPAEWRNFGRRRP